MDKNVSVCGSEKKSTSSSLEKPYGAVAAAAAARSYIGWGAAAELNPAQRWRKGRTEFRLTTGEMSGQNGPDGQMEEEDRWRAV